MITGLQVESAPPDRVAELISIFVFPFCLLFWRTKIIIFSSFFRNHIERIDKIRQKWGVDCVNEFWLSNAKTIRTNRWNCRKSIRYANEFVIGCLASELLTHSRYRTFRSFACNMHWNDRKRFIACTYMHTHWHTVHLQIPNRMHVLTQTSLPLISNASLWINIQSEFSWNGKSDRLHSQPCRSGSESEAKIYLVSRNGTGEDDGVRIVAMWFMSSAWIWWTKSLYIIRSMFSRKCETLKCDINHKLHACN